MRRSVGLPKKVVACALAALLGLSGVYVPDVAWAQEEPAVPEWAVDDGEAQEGFSTQAVLPNTYDLRNEGLVTPVKFQNPWGSCWAFGGIAAAETSMISAYGSTYEDSKLDLSERHLSYFALQPVTETVNPLQVGEGLHTFDPSPNAAFNAGGQPVYITTLFSQGIGPMLEGLYPYRGNNNRTTKQDYEDDPAGTTMEMLAAELGGEEAARARIQSEADGLEQSYNERLQYYVALAKQVIEASPTYSKKDDWSIPETSADGSPNRLVSNGMVLRNGNVLPKYWEGGDLPNQAGIEAIKQEILNGRAVSIGFFVDQGSTYCKTASAESRDRAQYVYDKLGMTHAVCIVGWDDNYSRENFYHTAQTIGQDGEPVDRTEETTPPGDGAWIVKNSYGSETEFTTDDLGNTINRGTYGNLNEEGKATGYFYLSYYDKTIQQTESMEFDAGLVSEGNFYVLQHDYMPANGGFYTTPATPDVTSSANVFQASTGAIALKSVSTRTSETNARVTLAIYELNDNATNPTDGKMIYRISRNFEYGGFHRLDIDRPITIASGKKFSVVSTMSTVNPEGTRDYSVAANQGASKAFMEAAAGAKAKVYSTAVINEGESFLYTNGEWVDWKDYTNGLPADDEIKGYLPNAEKHVEAAPIDNFSIKVYGVPTEELQPEPTTFPDVPEDAWYYGMVTRAAELGLFHGYWDGRFGPNDNLTRGELAVVLWNMDGGNEPGPDAKTFDDVAPGAFCAKAIAWASGAGVVGGYGNGKFGPNDPINREQLAVMLTNYARLKGKETSGSADNYKHMSDAASVSKWAESSVGWCFAQNVMSGSGDKINPKGSATRAEAAKMTVMLHDLLTS